MVVQGAKFFRPRITRCLLCWVSPNLGVLVAELMEKLPGLTNMRKTAVVEIIDSGLGDKEVNLAAPAVDGDGDGDGLGVLWGDANSGDGVQDTWFVGTGVIR